MKLSYEFQNASLLQEALTHRSYAHECRQKEHNERLELLGDSVVGVILTELLLHEYPEASEGDLSKYRAGLVNETSLALLAQHLGLARSLKLGKGELSSGGLQKPRLLASAFEALVGAVFLDAGFERTRQLVCGWFREHWEELWAAGSQDFKTALQERVQERARDLPRYEVVEESGPSHDRWFRVQVRVGERILAEGEGRSKKQAEQQAAKTALETYQ